MLWYNAILGEAEERVCKQAGECILLLSKWRSRISGLSCKSRTEVHVTCFFKFLFRKEGWETSEEQHKSNAGLEVVSSHQGAHCVKKLGIQSSWIKILAGEWTRSDALM